jgi:hypothetical protein
VRRFYIIGHGGCSQLSRFNTSEGNPIPRRSEGISTSTSLPLREKKDGHNAIRVVMRLAGAEAVPGSRHAELEKAAVVVVRGRYNAAQCGELKYS